MKSFNKLFWADAGERAIRTVAQALLSVLTLDSASVLTLDWPQTLGLGLTAGVISLLMSIIASGAGDKTNASFIG